MPRKVDFMVSLKSYRIQLSSASCNYKSKMNLQKTAMYVFSKLGARHVWWAWLSWFCIVLIAIGKMEILYTSFITSRTL